MSADFGQLDHRRPGSGRDPSMNDPSAERGRQSTARGPTPEDTTMAERPHDDETSRPPGALDRGPATALGLSRSRTIGVLEMLTDSFGPVPRVLLRDADGGPEPPIVRPGSDEVPARPDAGRYQFFGEIARGGMGAVLKGRDPDLGRELAVKVLLEKHRDDPEMVCRFVEEAQIAGQLQHPGIVPIYEMGTFADRRPYFAMRLVKGRTLASLLSDRTSPRRDLSRFLAIFEAVAQTVAYAHARAVIHRDLKPSNVMVGAFGEVQVMDWGLAKVLSQGGVADDVSAGRLEEETVIATTRSASDSDLSLAGSVMGTPSYMAPEQARGEVNALDERTDVFALGSMLAEIMTGKPAFTGRNADEIHRSAARGDLAPAFARLDADGSDPELIALARTCLRPERDDRPRDAGEIARTIGSYRAGVEDRLRVAEISRAAEAARAEEAQRTAEAAQARANAERRARRATAALAASVLVLVVVGGVVAFRVSQQRQVRESRLALMLDEAEALRPRARARSADPAQWQSLVEAVKRTDDLVVEGGGDREIRGRLIAMREEADAGLLTAIQDRALLEKLAEIRANRQDAGSVATRAAYDVAFREAGFDLNTLVPAEAARSLERRPASVRAEIAAFLDDWYRSDIISEEWHEAAIENRVLLSAATFVERSGAVKLRELARLIDPDEFRDRLRSLPDHRPLKDFPGKLRELAADPRAESLPAPTSVLMASFFEATGAIDAAIAVLRKAVMKHPEDLWVNYRLAVNLLNANPPRLEESARYFTAARSIRPTTAHMLAHVLSDLERTDQAKAVFLDLAARRPEDWGHLACLAIDMHDLGPGKKREAESIAGRLIPTLRSAVLKSPTSREYYILARLQMVKGDSVGALASLRELEKAYPGFKYQAHELMGLSYSETAREHEAAASVFRDLIRLKPEHVMSRLNLGRALTKLGRHKEAIAELREAIRLRPADFMIWANLGSALMASDRIDEAMAAYREAMRLQPARVSVHLQLASDLAARGKPDEAIAAYREAARVDPDNTDPHNLLGRYLDAVKGDFAAAAAEFREVMRINPDEPDARSNLGFMLFKAGKPAEALAECREAARLRPDHAEARLKYGAMLANVEHDHEAALVEVRAAIRLRPDGATYRNLGQILYLLKGHDDEAITAFREAIRLGPGGADVHSDLGKVLSEAGKPGEAIAAYREAIRLGPVGAPVHMELGLLLSEAGKPDEAIAAYREAIRLEPARAAFHVQLGRALGERGKPEGAIAALREAVRLNPGNAEAHDFLGMHLINAKGELDAAATEFRAAIRCKPDDVDAHFALGQILFKRGRPDDALAEFREAARLKPDFAPARLKCAEFLVDHSHDYDAALVEIQAAVRLNPDAKAHVVHGRILAQLKKRAEAIAAFRSALALIPRPSEDAENLTTWIAELERGIDLKDPLLR
jgi:tetratricopeptide (TPR) repeat protein/tRNA A-37 threonylcarbamoyl transferase component Bud32